MDEADASQILSFERELERFIHSPVADRIAAADEVLRELPFSIGVRADELGYANSSFQYALGKRMINTGAQQMLTLNSGHLYDLQSDVSMEPAIANVLAMKDFVPEGTPFLFVYEHPTIYDPD